MFRKPVFRLAVIVALAAAYVLNGLPDRSFSSILEPRVARAAAAANVPCGTSLTAVADTYINQAVPNTNFGNSPQLLVGRSGANAQHALLAFTLGRALPPGAAIIKAELELTVSDAQVPASFSLEVREIAAQWDELKPVWNAQPAQGTRYGAVIHYPDTRTLRVDVTPTVTRWHAGTEPNYGLALLPVDAERAISFSSRNTATGGPPPTPPKLIISCALPEIPAGIDHVPGDQIQQAGLARLRQASQSAAQLRLNRGALSFALLDLPVPQSAGGDAHARASWFLRDHKAALRLADPDKQLQLSRRSEDGQSLFYRQLHNGIPVVGATLGVHLQGAKVLGVGGSYVPEIATSATPRLTMEQAETLAAALMGDGSVRPNLKRSLGNGLLLPAVVGQSQLRYFNPAVLGYGDPHTYLTWQVNVTGPGGQRRVFIDAFNGALRHTQSQVMDAFDLEYLADADNEMSSNCWLYENTEEWFDEDGVVSGANPDAEGHAAFNNIQTVYNYWNNRFGRDSYDDDGEEIEMYVHVGQNWTNAQYRKGVCDIFEYGDSYAAVTDIVGHEFTHAVNANEADLIYESQSGALNESFADIFGYFVDNGDWTLGEGSTGADPPNSGASGCVSTAAIRDFSNPPCQNQPDHMQASMDGLGTGIFMLSFGEDPECDKEDDDYNDCGFVHTNSGIHNKAAFLIIAGGTHAGQRHQRVGHRHHQGRAAVLQRSDQPVVEQRAADRRARYGGARSHRAVPQRELLGQRRVSGQERLRRGRTESGHCQFRLRRHARQPGNRQRRRRRAQWQRQLPQSGQLQPVRTTTTTA